MADTNFIITVRQQGAQQAIQQMQPLIATLQQLGNVNVQIKPGVDNLAKSQTGLATALAGLTSRALLTIPVWMALRSAFMGGIRVVEDSVKSIVDMDTALKHLEMQLINTKDAAQTLAQVKIQAQSLALTTGESPASLIDVYSQLYTVGFKAADAFKGMQIAAKGALATNSESKDITSVLVNVYKELGDKITAVHAPADKLNYILNTMSMLMTKNHLNVTDFEGSLKTFTGQATQSNLTLDQTLGLIAASANVSQTGQLAGRGLTGMFRQISLQRPAVEDLLGKSTSGQSDFNTFLDILNRLKTMSNSDITGISEMNKIFSLRGGGQVLRALGGDASNQIAQNMQALQNANPDQRQSYTNQRVAIAQDEIKTQQEEFSRTLEYVGRSFISAITGTNDFATAIKNLSKDLLDAKPAIEGFGKVIKDFLTGVNSPHSELKRIGQGGEINASDFSPNNIFRIFGLVGDLVSNANSTFKLNATTNANIANSGFTGNALDNIGRNRALRNSINSSATIASGGSNIPSAYSTANPSGSAQISDADIAIQQQINDMKKEEAVVDKQLESFGYTKLEILNQQLVALEKQGEYGTNLVEIEKTKLEIEKEYASEVAKSSSEYMGSAQKGLTDLFMGNVKVGRKGTSGYNPAGPLGAIAGEFGKSNLEQQDSAFAGNITQHLLGGTGLANTFGKQIVALQNDPTYQATYHGIIDGLKDSGIGGGSKSVSATGSTPASVVANNLLQQTGWSLSAGGFNKSVADTANGMLMTAHPVSSLQAFGGGTSYFAGTNALTSSKAVASTGSSPVSGINSFIQKYMGISPSGQFSGTLPGFGTGGFMNKNLFSGWGNTNTSGWSLSSGGSFSNTSPMAKPIGSTGSGNFTALGLAGSLYQGFSTYQALGGNQGSMALPSSLLGTAGSIADMIPGGQVIGGALSLIGGILGLFNTKTTVTNQVSTHQVASKLDESNKQLTMINRNLVGMKSSIDTYIMPNSAYFATKGNLSDQFAIDAQRA